MECAQRGQWSDTLWPTGASLVDRYALNEKVRAVNPPSTPEPRERAENRERATRFLDGGMGNHRQSWAMLLDVS